MKLGKLLLTLVLTVLSSIGCAADYSSLRNVVYPVIVYTSPDPYHVNTIASSGSAVLIDNGYALTAAHVVPTTGSQSMYVVSNRQSFVATPIKVDREHDLALLAVNIQCPCAVLSAHIPKIDDKVVAIGYPMYLNYQIQFATVGYLQGWYDGHIIATADTAPGGSGGGLFWKDRNTYQLVGLTVAIATVPIGPRIFSIEQERTWMAFSVPSSVIHLFLKGTGIPRS